MTQNYKLTRAVRARMATTGERYAVALARLRQHSADDRPRDRLSTLIEQHPRCMATAGLVVRAWRGPEAKYGLLVLVAEAWTEADDAALQRCALDCGAAAPVVMRIERARDELRRGSVPVFSVLTFVDDDEEPNTLITELTQLWSQEAGARWAMAATETLFQERSRARAVSRPGLPQMVDDGVAQRWLAPALAATWMLTKHPIPLAMLEASEIAAALVEEDAPVPLLRAFAGHEADAPPPRDIRNRLDAAMECVRGEVPGDRPNVSIKDALTFLLILTNRWSALNTPVVP